ncbi:MAG TPA: PAS domain S-box protein [Albitalea sp.]|nr:PAS domain S-box protein [Albitalea sp.]
MRPSESLASSQPLRQFFDHLSDAVLLLDRHARITFANTAALRSLPCETGMPVDQLRRVLGDGPVQWLKQRVATAASGRTSSAPAPSVALPDGRRAQLAWHPLDATHSALRLQLGPVPAAPSTEPELPKGMSGPAVAGLIRLFWKSPFPATLQDMAFRIIDVNQAYLDFCGYPRERLIGVDPLDMQPEEDRAGNRAARSQITRDLARKEIAPLVERRIVDAAGRERWFRAARSVLEDDQGRQLYLVVLQDSTAEHAARERADRSARELDDWFDLSPVGMVLFDEAGLLVRTNPAFDALVGEMPALLSESAHGVQMLLAWQDGAPSAQLQPGSKPLVVQGWVAHADGSQRRLRSTVRCYKTPGGQRRFMAVVEDRSIEEERDLAQMQIGALIDTAGVGLATFQESSGWVRQRLAPAGGDEAAPSSAALQAISRDIVLPESMPEYERLQHALRHAQRAEVRYAVRHPELGQRWLLTRVEPATLASGQRTTSVVTLDITEQQQNQARSEQLLHEMATILESTTAGIAYLRGNVLVRCNRRFETMLGLAGGGVAGSSLQGLFGESALGPQIAAGTLDALEQGAVYETEFEMPPLPGSDHPQWLALSVRRSGPVDGPMEAIAVVSDITRLKTQQMELEILARDRELMFSLSEVGIAFVRHGRLQRANDALAQLAGYPAAELSGLPLRLLFADEVDHQRQWMHEEAALRRDGRWVGERQLKRRDGRLLWVQVSKRLVVEGDPAGGIIASYVNVDDRHRAEQAVALQADRTRAILDSVLVGIVTVGPNGIEWMNRSARRMFGGDLADFMNQPISTVATGDPKHPFLQTHYRDELVEGQAETFECKLKARDGREFWVVGNAVATGRESTGRQLTYALLDIERRRQAEARTAEAQASLQRIIEAAPMAITLRDARSLRILQVNQVAARSAERTPGELIGLTPEELFAPAIAVERRRDMETALASHDVTQLEYRVDGADGETRVWDARYLPLASPGQPPDQLLLVATDVTEQRAAQQAKFEAALAQREMLVKEVHHRIKNNLQGVAGLLQQIAQRKPEVAPAIHEVVGQVQAIAQVYGLQVGVTGPLRMKSVLEAITGSVQRTFGHPIMLSLLGPAPHQWALPEAESIPIALTVNELLTNAVKHSIAEHGTMVSCKLLCSDSGVQIVISNKAHLPSGFTLARFPGGVSGLGLVRSLLPRRSAKLTLEQQGDEVVATVLLEPPGIHKLAQV